MSNTSSSRDDSDELAGVLAPATPAPVPVARDETDISEDEERADEYKETYLKMWNNTTNPKEVSCRTAFDIMFWCYGPASQLRSMYRTGQSTTCAEQRQDLALCFKVKAAAMKNPEEAKNLLRADRIAKQDPRPHVWQWRTQPPEQFRQGRQGGMADVSSATEILP